MRRRAGRLRTRRSMKKNRSGAGEMHKTICSPESGKEVLSRRGFLGWAGNAIYNAALSPGRAPLLAPPSDVHPPDYILRIGASSVEIAPKNIVSTIAYNGQFPGPLLRFKEDRLVTVEVHNDTDTPEQLHWHGQFVRTDVDGAVEEGTPFIPPRGMRRIVFTPR